MDYLQLKIKITNNQNKEKSNLKSFKNIEKFSNYNNNNSIKKTQYKL